MTTLPDEPDKLPRWQFFKRLWCGSNQKLYLIYIVFSIFVLMVGVIVLFDNLYRTEQSANSVDHRSLVMLSQLHDLRGQLQQIADNTNNPATIRNTISSLTGELDKIEKAVSDNAKTSDVKKVSDQLVTVQSDLSDLEKIISTQFNTKKYMDAKGLPFQVNHLDMISGQPFVSVDYDHHITPLGIGDSLNGWTLSAADYAGQAVEFSNTQGQYVKINLAI